MYAVVWIPILEHGSGLCIETGLARNLLGGTCGWPAWLNAFRLCNRFGSVGDIGSMRLLFACCPFLAIGIQCCGRPISFVLPCTMSHGQERTVCVKNAGYSESEVLDLQQSRACINMYIYTYKYMHMCISIYVYIYCVLELFG